MTTSGSLEGGGTDLCGADGEEAGPSPAKKKRVEEDLFTFGGW